MNSQSRRKLKRKFKYTVTMTMASHTQWRERWESFSDREEWLLTNVGKRNKAWMIDKHYQTYLFHDSKIATLFALRWV